MKRNITHILVYLFAGLSFLSCSKNEYESGGTISPVISMANVKALHNGEDVQLLKENLDGAYQIAGVVISDKDHGNFNPNEIVVQNNYRGTITGLVMSFTDQNTQINLGDSVKIDIDKAVLTRKNGSLKITGTDFKFDRVIKVASNIAVSARTLSLTTLYSNFNTYESTLVQLNGMGFEDIANGQTYAGDNQFLTESASRIYLSTLSTASFAQKSLPLLADFVGIPTYFDPNSDHYNRSKTLLKIRNDEDVFNETGAAYLHFPESFEAVEATEKSNFLMPEIDDTIVFASGSWKLYQAIIGDRASYDRFNPLNGIQAIRMQEKLTGSAYLEMNFDLNHGASKVEVMHAIYGLYTINPQVAAAWDLEYSQDQGQTWNKVGETVAEVNTRNPTIVTFNVNIKGNVRFRINKLGYSGYLNGQTGMLNIDDFTVYQNVD